MKCWWSSLIAITLAVKAGAVEVDFARDVLPIIQNHCVDCHGPDEQESKLRLDSMADALGGGDSGEPIIVPGHSDQSYLIELVTSQDESHRMPPDGDRVSQTEIAVLKSWIDNADLWRSSQAQLRNRKTDHWSLQPLVRTDPPLSNDASGDADDHAIDAFVNQKLQASGLKMSPRADRRRLIRRLYLVMHGVPPTPEQVAAFLSDKRPDAWEQLVEEVLRSPRYGERFATHWLDLVRFGETNGYETNRERPNAWRYRDWVIDAFNTDKPYNDFVIQQLAGDAVGDDVGTGFLVAGPYDNVKGQDPKLGLMQRQDELADMINATGTAFMGLTLGCARCHNHKFDPVTQTDYYALQAVFAGVKHADRKLPPSAEQAKELARIKAKISELTTALAKFVPPDPIANDGGNDAKRKGASAAKPRIRPAVNAKRNVEQFPPVAARFVRMTIHATNQSEPCIDELEVFAKDANVALASVGAKATSGGDFVHPLHKLSHINDGKFGNAKSWIAKQRGGGWVQIEFAQQHSIEKIVWARDREGRFSDRLATDYKIDVSLDGRSWSTVASSADRLPFDRATGAAPNYDFDAFPAEEARRGRQQLDELNQLTKRRSDLEKSAMHYGGTFSQPGPTHRLYRGEPEARREEVSPDAIASIGRLGLAKESPERERRLALAKWIASGENPLTARVMVNRLWQFQFGTGIVDTPSDFGGNGTMPTHGELLDWLAAEFIQSGWSIKHMQRLMLTSATWQQDSRPHQDAMKVDASTRLLWRFPPRRLEAEGIRDCILATTGKLSLKSGGPGFSAFEVEMENVRHYHPKQEFGPDDWRRMIYMTRVRQERDAVFGVFDCPDGSQVTPKRSRSTTPLQALNLLNSRFVNQQAEFLAERLNVEADSVENQVRRAYELCYAIEASEVEIAEAAAFIDRYGMVQFARALLNSSRLVFIT